MIVFKDNDGNEISIIPSQITYIGKVLNEDRPYLILGYGVNHQKTPLSNLQDLNNCYEGIIERICGIVGDFTIFINHIEYK